MRLAAAACVIVATMPLVAVAVEETPLHGAQLATLSSLTSAPDGTDWRVKAQDLTAPLIAIAPALCTEHDGWSACASRVRVEVTMGAKTAEAYQYLAFVARPGARCYVSAVVPLKRWQSFSSLYTEVKFYPDRAAIQTGPTTAIFKASQPVAEKLSDPATLIETCHGIVKEY